MFLQMIADRTIPVGEGEDMLQAHRAGQVVQVVLLGCVHDFTYMLRGSCFLCKRSGIAQSLRPVTIKQLRAAEQAHPDAEWHIGEIEIGPVCGTLPVRSSVNSCSLGYRRGARDKNQSASDELYV